jgi:hypothetical protein
VSNIDLRPLSLGEILDRTFSLYRNNFLLFIGITAIPQLLILSLHLAQLFLFGYVGTTRVDPTRAALSGDMIFVAVLAGLLGFVAYIGAYLFAQGGTVFAVSDLYLGRTTTIGQSLGRMRGEVMNLFGVTLLNGIAIGGATLLLIIPGIWLACRLIVCVPAALLENLGPADSLGRSFELTDDSAGRSFVIYLIYFVVAIIAGAIFNYPFSFMVALSSLRHPEALRMWVAFAQIGQSVAEVVATPILLIATAIFYYDLRVRKEAFDLQFMLNPNAAAPSTPGTSPSGVPSMFS